MKPTLYLSDIEIEHLKAGHKVVNDQAIINFTNGTKIGSNDIFDNRDKFKKPVENFITFICVSSHGTDSYYDDEIQGEVHTIDRTSKVEHIIVPVSDAKKFYNDYLEMNADNPPYDTYSIKMAYWSESQEPISLRQFQEGC